MSMHRRRQETAGESVIEMQTLPSPTLRSPGGNMEEAELAEEPRRRVCVLKLFFIIPKLNLLDQDLPEFDPQPPFVLVSTRNNHNSCRGLSGLL